MDPGLLLRSALALLGAYALFLLATVNGMAVECAADPDAVTEEQVTGSIAAVLRAALAP